MADVGASRMEEENQDSDDEKEEIKSRLTKLQKKNMTFQLGKDFEMTEELRSELNESLQDLLAMREFIISHPPNDDGHLVQNKQGSEIPEKKKTLKVISWDVGMLCYQYMARRAEFIAELILKGDFDVVFLQELNHYTFLYLKCRLDGIYMSYTGKTQRPVHKFKDVIATFIRVGVVDCITHRVIAYKNTAERRCLLKTDVVIGNAKLCLLNTHLESKKKNSVLRIQQLKKCFSICQSVDSGSHVIFSGSLNIRDFEAEKTVPQKVTDMWSQHGSEDSKFTWDLRNNQLVQMPVLPKTGGQPRKRFGRMYFRAAFTPLITPRAFELLGKEIVVAGKYCASDNWALVSTFFLDRKCYEKENFGKDKTTKVSPPRHADLLPDEDKEKQEKVKDNWDDSD